MGKTSVKKRCLILGGGSIIDYAAVSAQVESGDFILCADSGFLHCEKLGLKADALIGDFDSLPPGLIPSSTGIEIISYPAEKDYTDSRLAIDHAVKLGCTEILMAGMLGGRLDHTLANLQTLAWCEGNGVKAKITDGMTEIVAAKDGSVEIKAREKAYFSVFSLTTLSRGVTILNGKYPLTNYDLRFDDARAVSNEFCGRDVTVSVLNGVIAVIITPKM